MKTGIIHQRYASHAKKIAPINGMSNHVLTVAHPCGFTETGIIRQKYASHARKIEPTSGTKEIVKTAEL